MQNYFCLPFGFQIFNKVDISEQLTTEPELIYWKILKYKYLNLFKIVGFHVTKGILQWIDGSQVEPPSTKFPL
jgi:hypothetical protein